MSRNKQGAIMSCGNPFGGGGSGNWEPTGNQTGRKVFCVKFQKELPGLDEPPFGGEIGEKIYNNVSAEAWKLWGEHCKMLLNEYRLNPANKQDQELIVKQMEQYFFGEGAALPANYVPPKAKH